MNKSEIAERVAKKLVYSVRGWGQSSPQFMTAMVSKWADEIERAIAESQAPDWREHLNDGKVLDHIVTVLCFPANEARRRKLKVNAYNREYHLKKGRGRLRQKAASA